MKFCEECGTGFSTRASVSRCIVCSEILTKLLRDRIDHLSKTKEHVERTGIYTSYCMGDETVAGDKVINNCNAEIVQCQRILEHKKL